MPETFSPHPQETKKESGDTFELSEKFKKEVLDEMTPQELGQFARAHQLQVNINLDRSSHEGWFTGIYLSLTEQNVYEVKYAREFSLEEIKKIQSQTLKSPHISEYRNKLDTGPGLQAERIKKEAEELAHNLQTVFIEALKKTPALTLRTASKGYASDAVKFWPRLIASAKSGQMGPKDALGYLYQLQPRFNYDTKKRTTTYKLPAPAPSEIIDNIITIYWKLEKLMNYFHPGFEVIDPSGSDSFMHTLVTKYLLEGEQFDVGKYIDESFAGWQKATDKKQTEFNELKQQVDDIRNKLLPPSLETPELPPHPYR